PTARTPGGGKSEVPPPWRGEWGGSPPPAHRGRGARDGRADSIETLASAAQWPRPKSRWASRAR
uniref:Uncharacterized protein n=2 Tax=Ixodes scapularis TaxID=6945 RepID=A0A1S4KVK6_IXOSC